MDMDGLRHENQSIPEQDLWIAGSCLLSSLSFALGRWTSPGVGSPAGVPSSEPGRLDPAAFRFGLDRKRFERPETERVETPVSLQRRRRFRVGLFPPNRGNTKTEH